MNNKKIDIILPNYNKKCYVAECLASLICQSYQNWRCLVVDGFSEDGSWEIIQDFARNDSRFELYQIPRTGNLYRAWNFGLSKVTNSYFCILTSDDVWDKNWLEVAVRSLENNQNAVCAAARTRIIDTNGQWGNIAIHNLMGEKFFQTQGSQHQLRDGITSSIANYFLGAIYTSIHSLVMRSDILKKKENFAEDVGSVADYEWYIKLSLNGDVIYHPDIEVGWRKYEGQATKPRENEKNKSFIQKIHLRTKDEIARKLDGLADEFRVMAQQYDCQVLSYHYGRPCLANLRTQPITEFMKLLRICFKSPKAVFMDSLLKIEGKSYYVEESLYIARKMLNFMLFQKL